MSSFRAGYFRSALNPTSGHSEEQSDDESLLCHVTIGIFASLGMTVGRVVVRRNAERSKLVGRIFLFSGLFSGCGFSSEPGVVHLCTTALTHQSEK